MRFLPHITSYLDSVGVNFTSLNPFLFASSHYLIIPLLLIKKNSLKKIVSLHFVGLKNCKVTQRIVS